MVLKFAADLSRGSYWRSTPLGTGCALYYLRPTLVRSGSVQRESTTPPPRLMGGACPPIVIRSIRAALAAISSLSLSRRGVFCKCVGAARAEMMRDKRRAITVRYFITTTTHSFSLILEGVK